MESSGLFELACRDAACAPPPVGTGGSTPGFLQDAAGAVEDWKGAWSEPVPEVVFGDEALKVGVKAERLDGVPEFGEANNRPLFVEALLMGKGESPMAERAALSVSIVQEKLVEKYGADGRVILYRAPDGMGGFEDPLRDRVPSASGVTSWSTDRRVVATYGSQAVVAAIPVRQILAWDTVGLARGRGEGEEVLVSADPAGPGRAVRGEFPVLKRRTYTGARVEFGWEEQPRDELGRWTDAGGAVGLRDSDMLGRRVRNAVAAGDVETAGGLLAARQVALGFDALSGDEFQVLRAEFKALSDVVPVPQGMVRQGTAEAEALIEDVQAVLPNAKVGLFGDVDPEKVRRVLDDGIGPFPAEVRERVKGVALGYVENPGHVAAFGPSRERDRRVPSSTLWLGPKALGPGRLADGDKTTVHMAPADRKLSVVGAHEMGHVVHLMALHREGKDWSELTTDSEVPDGWVEGGPKKWSPNYVQTTRYGATNRAELIGETFGALAYRGFGQLTPEQKGLIEHTLDRAGLAEKEQRMLVASSGEEFEDWIGGVVGDSFELGGETVEEFGYDPSQPRDSRGRWTEIGGDSVEQIMRDMGAQALEGGQEIQSQLYPGSWVKNPKSGFMVRSKEVSVPTVVHLKEPGPVRVVDTVRDFNDKPVSEPRPPEYLYRAISEEDWQNVQRTGELKSDGRMNLDEHEGTVAALSDPTYYLPGGLASQKGQELAGRVVRIKYRDEDGWWYDPADGYAKTPNAIPIEQIDAVTVPIVKKDSRYVSPPWRKGGVRASAEFGFDPNQPRDAEGRWTTVGWDRKGSAFRYDEFFDVVPVLSDQLKTYFGGDGGVGDGKFWESLIADVRTSRPLLSRVVKGKGSSEERELVRVAHEWTLQRLDALYPVEQGEWLEVRRVHDVGAPWGGNIGWKKDGSGGSSGVTSWSLVGQAREPRETNTQDDGFGRSETTAWVKRDQVVARWGDTPDEILLVAPAGIRKRDLEFGFDPNQPRDADGRWTKAGGMRIEWGSGEDTYKQLNDRVAIEDLIQDITSTGRDWFDREQFQKDYLRTSYINGHLNRWGDESGGSQEERLQAARKAADEASERELATVAWTTEYSVHNALRSAISANLKSPNPDPGVIRFMQTLHTVNLRALGGPGAHLWLTRSWSGTMKDDIEQSGTPFDGMTPSRYGNNREGDKATSGVTSWAMEEAKGSDNGWGGHKSKELFPISQILFREGTIQGEFLVARDPEIVTRLMTGKFPISGGGSSVRASGEIWESKPWI